VEGQKRNTAQLERIGTTMEQRWGLEEESRQEENKGDEKGSKDGPRENQEGGLHRPPPVSILVLFFLIEFVISCELNV